MEKSLFELNETVCFDLLIDRDSLEEQWSRSRCQVLQSGTTLTTCLCSLPVHVAVFVRSREVEQFQNEERSSAEITSDKTLLFGCTFALCGILASLLIYLFACSGVRSVCGMVRVNIMLSVVVVLAVCVVCLLGRHVQTVCAGGQLLLSLGLVGVFSFLFVDAMHMYVAVHALRPRDLAECWGKFFVIGWGIPFILVGSTAVVGSLYGHNNRCQYWCWLDPSSWHFFPFLVASLGFALVCVLVCIKCVVRVASWTHEGRFRDRKDHIVRAVKNVSILIVLTGVTWAGCDVQRGNGDGAKIVFVLLLILLVGVIFTAYCVSERKVMKTLCYVIAKRNDQHCKTSSSHSFRAFVMPENIEETRSTEEEIIHRLCTHRNSTRSTSERKQQLRFLLGSANSPPSPTNQTARGAATAGRDAGGVIVYPGENRALAREEEEFRGGDSLSARTEESFSFLDRQQSESSSRSSELSDDVSETCLIVGPDLG
ncbi:adhesion G-protein coupled receptor G6-like [Babylonia areolata]|uniref:adhesion G-protein coupled receptor G6-like n=1 Tax=Babylonia areolata TaxID=304850 RepID=UPI003FD0C2F1